MDYILYGSEIDDFEECRIKTVIKGAEHKSGTKMKTKYKGW